MGLDQNVCFRDEIVESSLQKWVLFFRDPVGRCIELALCEGFFIWRVKIVAESQIAVESIEVGMVIVVGERGVNTKVEIEAE